MGVRVAEIGPIPGISNEPYTASYMESGNTAGISSDIHRHDGPELFYTLMGKLCVETPDGSAYKQAERQNPVGWSHHGVYGLEQDQSCRMYNDGSVHLAPKIWPKDWPGRTRKELSGVASPATIFPRFWSGNLIPWKSSKDRCKRNSLTNSLVGC